VIERPDVEQHGDQIEQTAAAQASRLHAADRLEPDAIALDSDPLDGAGLGTHPVVDARAL
jgi:hypothetical protein